MTMRHTCLFTGTITTREPLAWSPPGHVGPDKRALLPRMTVPTAAGPMESAFLGASTIRGRYRHACADRCLERERPVSLSRFLELKVGGVKGSAEDRRVDVRERIAFLEGEPVLSLFGAGASPIGWVHGRLDVGTALPSEPIEPVLLNGRRGNATEDPILLDVLDAEEVTRVRGGLDANRRRSRAVAEIRALRQRIARATRAGEDASELLLELEAARESEDGAARAQCELVGSDVSLLLPLPGYEALPTGTVLSHRMYLRHVSRRRARPLHGGCCPVRRGSKVRRPPRARLRTGRGRVRREAHRRGARPGHRRRVDRPRTMGPRREQPCPGGRARPLARGLA